jgi:hypothetical protein
MKKYTGIELMETAPVRTAIIRLALPMIAAMLAQAIYNMTDMFFIGQTGDPNMVAADSAAWVTSPAASFAVRSSMRRCGADIRKSAYNVVRVCAMPLRRTQASVSAPRYAK